MKKYKVVLCIHRTKINGENPVVLRITKDRKVKYITLGLSALPAQWDEQFGRYNEKKKKDILVHPNFMENNAFLNSQETKAKDVIYEFDHNKIDWTLNQFEDAFHHRSKKGKVKPFFEQHISTLRATGHIGNADCYERTMGMLELFDKNFSKKIFSEIDIKYIRSFDIFLQTPRQTISTSKTGKVRTIQRKGCSGNTRKYYFKTLRAIINQAIESKEASQTTYPFGKGGFEIAKLEEETDKRYLPSDYLLKIKSTVSTSKNSEYARKLFLFSYYCYGMSFVDMAGLTADNIQRLENGQYLVYKRHKTMNSKSAKAISIKLTETLQTLILELSAIKAPVDNYILPIVTVQGLSGEKLYKHLKPRLVKLNIYLHEMAKEFGIDDINLTTYVSRHTMAMTLQNNEVPRELISQILGHKDMETTNTYLDSFNSNIIDEAVKVL